MTLKVGIIGTGGFARVHGRILSELAGVRVSAVYGRNLEKANEMAATFDQARGYDHLEYMLEAERLDAVYICLPPYTHGEFELELIKRRIPFFVEKPIGIDRSIPEKILQEVEAASLITSVGYHYRYTNSVQQLKELLSSRTVGMVLGQFMTSMPQVAWWRNQQQSGGQFIEQTTHIVDLLRYTCGEITSVHADYGHRVLREQDESVTVADVGTVNLRLENGVVANISNTCILPSHISRVGLSFYTNKGIIDWSPDKLAVHLETNRSESKEDSDPYKAESEAFIHAVRTGDTSRILSDYRDAYETHLVTLAALESANHRNNI